MAESEGRDVMGAEPLGHCLDLVALGMTRRARNMAGFLKED